MVLDKDEYKIENEGIWISKKALEQIRDHYDGVASRCHLGKHDISKALYMGKADVIRDLLKHFEQLEGE